MIIFRTYGTFAAVLKGLRIAGDSSVPGLKHIRREFVTTQYCEP